MRRLFTSFALVWTVIVGAPASAQNGPVVVELFTSQGCSSCPPADALLHELSQMPDVIALALHVDYWDYIGWEDSFASPDYTRRQHAYARAAHARSVYTPQMIINGTTHVVGSRTMQVMAALQAHMAQPALAAVEVAREGASLQVRAESTSRGDYLVQIFRYLPEATVTIGRGENAGKTITYTNIVQGWDVVGQWDGNGRFEADVSVAGDEPVVVVVQEAGMGAIIGAAQLN